MPFGIPWKVYSTYWVVAIISGFYGSHLVHHHYKPLDGYGDLVQAEVDRIRKLRAEEAAADDHKS